MAEVSSALPVGQQVTLPGHFDVPVLLEAARPLAKGFECRVRLPDGTLDEAVYLKMLPQPRLRFLVAADPGAGKTIMAGLLIKEMI